VVCSAFVNPQQAAPLRAAVLLSKPVEFERLARAVRSLTGSEKPGVLVVDDEAHVRQLLELVLTREGFRVWSAGGGRAAVEFYRRNQGLIGAVLLDVKMPGLDGPATLAALRQINPDVRALFISADPGAYAAETLLGMGADAVLQKPFDLSEVCRAVRGVLVRGQSDRQGLVRLNIHTTAELPLVLEPVAAAMARLGYPETDIIEVRLALEETLVSAVKYGKRGDPARQVRIRYRVTAEEVWVEVEDQRQGFDPGGVADPTSPGGPQQPSRSGPAPRRHSPSSVSLNERGNVVTLCKRRNG
jgi:DNA-binding response OmpR family regulator